MAIYCKTHQETYSPLPSGYHAPMIWHCGGGCVITRADMAQNRLVPEHLAGIITTVAKVGGVMRGRMVGFAAGAHLR